MGTKFSRSSKKEPSKISQKNENFAACNEGDVDWEFIDSFVKTRIQKIKHRQSSTTKTDPTTSTVDLSGSRYEFLVEQRGVSLSWLFSFAQEVFKTHESTITTRDVQRLVVVEETLASKRPLWDTVPSSEIGLPTVAISHSWNYQFGYLIQVLKAHCKSFGALRGHTYVWLDIIALTQHSDGSTQQKEEIAKIGDIFGHWIPTVVQIAPRSLPMSPVDDYGSFSRAWCVFELVSTLKNGGEFHIISEEITNLDWETPFSSIGYWRPSFSTALYESDKENITSLVLETVHTWSTLRVLALMNWFVRNNVGPMLRNGGILEGWAKVYFPNSNFTGERFMTHYYPYYNNTEV